MGRAFDAYQNRGLQHKKNEEDGVQVIETEDGVFKFPASLKIKTDLTAEEKATFVGALSNYKNGIIDGAELALIAERPDIYTTFGYPRAVEPQRHNADGSDAPFTYEDFSQPEKNIIEGAEKQKKYEEKVNHPSHYTQYKGVEVIDITEQLNFNRGNGVKYIARAGFKGEDTEVLDLQKAKWYITREITRLDDVGGSYEYTADAENLVEQMNYNRGSAVACICHAGTRDASSVKGDLQKAIYYLDRELTKLETYKEA